MWIIHLVKIAECMVVVAVIGVETPDIDKKKEHSVDMCVCMVDAID